MFKNVFLTVLLLTLYGYSSAQQNNVWYFGRRAGLDFNNIPGQPLPRALSNSTMDSNEGTSSICDSQGNILFYSNGVTIFNRNHQVMVNGDMLAGNNSSVQGSIIVPVPGNDSIFYIFTTDAIENNYVNGYRYSIINIRLQGGDGEVISKNNLLWSSCSERMVAARHANGTDIWVITNDNNSNIFRAWLVSCNGLQPSPVTSTVGIVMDQHFLMNNGMLKVSPDGRQLCQTHFPDVDIGSFANFCQLFNFDNASGILSNPVTIGFANTKFIACEFSPNSKFLYLTEPIARAIDQVECTLGSQAAIQASRVKFSTGSAGYYGIQLAPDGKIYLSHLAQVLGAINKTNVKGVACNFVEDQVSVAPGSGYLGLPAFINDLSNDPNNGFAYTILDSCTGRVQFNGFSTMGGTLSYQWDFGDGNMSGLQNPQHSYLIPAQKYTVKIKITSSTGCGYIERSQTIFPGGMVVNPDFDFIAKCDSGYVRFTNLSTVYPDPTGAQLVWDFDDGTTSTLPNPVHSFPLAGVYNIKLSLSTSTPCLDRSLTKILNLELLDILAFPNITVDAGIPVQLGVSGGGNYFVWTPATGLSDDSIANPIAMPPKDMMYKVTVTNDEGCKDTDSIYIKVNPYPGIYVPTGFTPNNDGLNDVIRPIITKEFKLEEFSIYNRWGERIFTTSTNGVGWNGRLRGLVQDTGVYVWIVNATDNRNGQKHRLKGTFVIIR